MDVKLKMVFLNAAVLVDAKGRGKVVRPCVSVKAVVNDGGKIMTKRVPTTMKMMMDRPSPKLLKIKTWKNIRTKHSQILLYFIT